MDRTTDFLYGSTLFFAVFSLLASIASLFGILPWVFAQAFLVIFLGTGVLMVLVIAIASMFDID